MPILGSGCCVNDVEPGPAQAIRYGFDQATADVVVVTMADGCDDPQQIDQLVRLVERGVVVAAASRYSRGGQQVGGPFLKSLLSRMRSRCGPGPGGHPGRHQLVQGLRRRLRPDGGDRLRRRVRDRHRAGGQGPAARLPVAEIPTIWLERHQGIRTSSWRPGCPTTCAGGDLPSASLPVEEIRDAAERKEVIDEQRCWSPVLPVHRRLRREGAARPRPLGRRHRQLLEVRTGRAVLRRPPDPTASSRATPGTST